MSPFKFAFKKIHNVSAPCCGPRSKNKGAASQEFPMFDAAGSSSPKKAVRVGLSSTFGKRNSCRATNNDSILATSSTCSTSVPDDHIRYSFTASTSTTSLPLETACATPLSSNAQASYPANHPDIEDGFLLASALSILDDTDGYQLASTLSSFSAASSTWSIDEIAQHDEEISEETVLEELQENVRQMEKQVVEKENHLKALEKEMRWDLFRRTRQQAHYGDCFAIVYCAAFRIRSIMRG